MHITKPCSVGQSKAMLSSMIEAGINHSEVSYINAHGTATEVGDIAETNSIKLAFGLDAAKKIAVSSTKAIHGHTLGAAGALELVITLQALENGIAPGTAFLETADPECDLNYLPLESIDLNIPVAMSNSFAFGGSNVSITVSKLREN
jgi:3-oxoacyl-[acyl-carrier-protein] synthase II